MYQESFGIEVLDFELLSFVHKPQQLVIAFHLPIHSHFQTFLSAK